MHIAGPDFIVVFEIQTYQVRKEISMNSGSTFSESLIHINYVGSCAVGSVF